MNLVLVGYRGTGKSTIGRLLAERLCLEYISLDDEIVKLAGKSIPEIVEEYSWDHFRDLEEKIVDTVSQAQGQVLDTGGGVVTRPQNIKRLRASGIVFLLETSVDDIVERIGGDDQRPSLTGEQSFTEEISEVLEGRRPLYEQAADYSVDTSKLTVELAVEEIIEKYRKRLGLIVQ